MSEEMFPFKQTKKKTTFSFSFVEAEEAKRNIFKNLEICILRKRKKKNPV